ncbi:MAG TPA: DegQ family serine endoprotease [Polyangiaceae bacterium]
MLSGRQFRITRSQRGLAALALALAGVAACTPPATNPPAKESQGTAPPGQAAAPVQVLPSPALAQAQAEGVSIADVVQKALPAVVNVSSSRVRQQRVPFHWFFGPGNGGPQERREQGQGSGVIVSASGVVLTNNHVVEKADEITVTTSDGREFEAKVLGTDPKSDLAVLQLQGDVSGLTAVTFGDSSQLRLGDVVLAIGNPFGIGQTVTMGIVSAKGRADLGIVDYEDFIQTDAAINPGNSGGALINMRGELVGINTAILSRSGGYQGVGFAIPSNMAGPIMQSLQQTGKVVRGWLGVAIQEVDQELAKAMKLPSADGVLISDVKLGGPADKAGLKRGDVVLSVGGQKVDTTGRLRNLVAQEGADKKVPLEIMRDGKRQTIQVLLGEMPTDPSLAGASPDLPGQDKLDGLVLENLAPALKQRFNIGGDVTRGAVVTDVEAGSPAAKAGLRPGDVIVEVNRKPVADVQAFAQLYKQRSGIALLLVHRGDSTVYVVVRR